MAILECRECGQQVSDTAEFCPHCGAPGFVRMEKSYTIRTGSTTRNNFAYWLKVIAVITLIVGLIYAIASANQQIASGYSTRTVFSWDVFLSVLSSYWTSAFVLWSLGKVVQMIHETHEMMAGVQLEVQQQLKHSAAGQAAARKPKPVWEKVQVKFGVCPSCGKQSTLQFLNARNECPECHTAYSDKSEDNAWRIASQEKAICPSCGRTEPTEKLASSGKCPSCGETYRPA